jgi:hypothetical protein
LCITDEHAVFLDLNQDEYTALEPSDARALAGYVYEWPSGANRHSEGASSESRELIRALLDEGLLTANGPAGKAATPVSLDRVTASFARPPKGIPRVDIGHVRNFTLSWVVATGMLRTLPLRLAVARAKRRKERVKVAQGGLDVLRAYELMLAYFVLQPNFFERENACLRDSMTVVEFLAHYGVFPTWVFGVRVNPFLAHSWVQAGPTVFNDFAEHVNTFTPIMAI